MFETRTTCRSCGSPDLSRIISLGETPLADALVTGDELEAVEPRFPLTVAFCPECSLMQILETVSPEMLYCQDYPYYSSFSPALLEHSKRNADSLIESRNLDSTSLVIEVASNDGYLLKNFAQRSIPVLGVDPAEGPAQAAIESGINTLCTFFSHSLALRLFQEGARADVVIANNVLAHVPDQNDFLLGIREVLKEDGVAVIEAPYVKDLIERCEFDTIYHEHHCYFSVTSVAQLLSRNGLYLNRVEHHPIHGGSLRLFAGRKREQEESVSAYLQDEARLGLDRLDYYQDFASRVRNIQRALLAMLRDLKAAGKTVAAYGAAAKGSTLLNCTGIGPELIDFVVDRNVHKQGKLMPGVHIPIYGPEKLLSDRPDYVLLLTWNFKDEILRQQEEYRRLGGKFIVPIPEPVEV